MNSFVRAENPFARAGVTDALICRCWRISVLLTLLLAPAAHAADTTLMDASPWVTAMREVHSRFRGEPGTFAQFGDSISYSDQFWSWLRTRPEQMDAETAAAYSVVNGYQNPLCWDQWKGPKFGNDSGTTLDWALQNIDDWLTRLNPETIVIMFGTNDAAGTTAEDYERKYRDLIERCLKNGSVVILTTIPPKNFAENKTAEFAEVVRKLAAEFELPLIDYHAEILSRRPNDWNGNGDKFRDVSGDVYQVPTLISGDGVHPSNPEKTRNFSEESLNTNGYVLRSYLTLHAYASVIRNVYRPSGWLMWLPHMFLGSVLLLGTATVIYLRRATKFLSSTQSTPPLSDSGDSVSSTSPTAAPAFLSDVVATTDFTAYAATSATVTAKSTSTEWQVLLQPQSSAAARSMPRHGLMIRSFPFRIGRHSESDEAQKLERPELVLDDKLPHVVSRSHLAIEVTNDGEICVRDLGSRMGVFIDGHHISKDSPHQQATLKPGVYALSIGSDRFRFQLVVEPQPSAITN